MLLKDLFKHIPDGCVIDMRAKKRGYHKLPDVFETTLHKRPATAINWAQQRDAMGYDTYFGVTPRREGAGRGKDAIEYVQALWVDYDLHPGDSPDKVHQDLAHYPLPPTHSVVSGTGYHFYWLLEKDHEIRDLDFAKYLLRELAICLGQSTVCAEPAHVLRVPYTHNYKDPDHILPVTVNHATDKRYTQNDLKVANNLIHRPPIVSDLVLSASRQVEVGERSEADWATINTLKKLDFSESAIEQFMWAYAPIDSKIRENAQYLPMTVAKAMNPTFAQTDARLNKKSASQLDPQFPPVVDNSEDDDGDGEIVAEPAGVHNLWKGPTGYLKMVKDGSIICISTFLIEVIAVQKSEHSAVESIIVNIESGRERWSNTVIPSKAFTSLAAFREWLPSFSLVWHGTDADVQKLKHLLVDEWRTRGCPYMHATSTLGRVLLPGGKDIYVTIRGGFNRDMVRDLDVIFVRPRSEYPKIDLVAPTDPTEVIQALAHVRNADVIAPMLGWFVAAQLKPLFEAGGIRFPHLIVYGTRGAGKTTLITQIFQPLSGYTQNDTWQANSTQFVLMKLLGATTNNPVCLTEFRESTQRNQGRFLQLLRTSYDQGQDARGSADQSMINYPLTAPLCIDGEENVSDPALQERVIPVYLDARETRQYSAGLKHILELDLHGAGSAIIQHTMSYTVEDVKRMHEAAMQQVDDTLAFRPHSNYACVLVGLMVIQDMLGGETPFPIEDIVMGEQPRVLVSPDKAGMERAARLSVHDFVEDVINHIMAMRSEGVKSGEVNYRYMPDKDGQFAGFQVKTAYNWWRTKMVSQRVEIPSLSAIQTQLGELAGEGGLVPYAKNAQTSYGRVMRMYFVDLKVATKEGLDIDVH